MEKDIKKYLGKHFDISQTKVPTPYGTLYLTRVKNRLKLYEHIGYIALDKQLISRKLYEFDFTKKLWKIFQEKHIFDFLGMVRELKIEAFGLYDLYLKVKKAFKYVFRKDVFDLIENADDYDFLVNLICEVNGFVKKKESKNPEITYYDNLKRELDRKKTGDVDFESIYTTIEAYTGRCPDDMTLYKFNALFSRIVMIMNYKTTIQLATFGGLKQPPKAYYAVIDNSNVEKTISKDEIGRKVKL